MPIILQNFPGKIRHNLLSKCKGKTILFPESLDERILEAKKILEEETDLKVLLIEQNDSCLLTAGQMLNDGKADAVVAGCVFPTANVIRAAKHSVGMKDNVKMITSAFLFFLEKPTPGGEDILLFSDCAVIPEPTSEQMVEIANLAQDAFLQWTSKTPHVSFLSFSTAGSADHPQVTKVRTAYQLFKTKYPDVIADGEIQFDAAVVPTVAKRKIPDNPHGGKSNVFIFPTLDAGNIAYKITQRLAGATALGPVLVGTKKPFSDLSRGATAKDIVEVSLLTIALDK